jgi:acylphosphatase
MNNDEPVREHVWVSGRVQGVWFRDACQQRARAEGVGGWVRNLMDGRVEAVFEGATGAVERMVAWCREGPPRAHVTDVEVRRELAVGEQGFAVR